MQKCTEACVSSGGPIKEPLEPLDTIVHCDIGGLSGGVLNLGVKDISASYSCASDRGVVFPVYFFFIFFSPRQPMNGDAQFWAWIFCSDFSSLVQPSGGVSGNGV